MGPHDGLCFIRRCVCPICGEVFYADCGIWAYKVPRYGTQNGAKRGDHVLCSWHCMREMERRKQERKYNGLSHHAAKEGV